MKVIYDDLKEFVEANIRCNNTVNSGQCGWCPLFDHCDSTNIESRRIMISEVNDNVWSGGEKTREEQDG